MDTIEHQMPHFETLAIECVGGVAGDMLLGAFLGAGANRQAIDEAFATLETPALSLKVLSVEVGNEPALWVQSIPEGNSLAASSSHGVSMNQVFETLDQLRMSPKARDYAKAIFTILGNAESKAHQVHFDSVHLHEVGELDSILDVAGVAIAYESLGSPRLKCSVLPSGKGTVQTSHGPLECPVPAVVAVADEFQIPLEEVHVWGETVTPTGIAILAGLGCEFLSKDATFDGRVLGRGAGTKRFADRPRVRGTGSGAPDQAEVGRPVISPAR